MRRLTARIPVPWCPVCHQGDQWITALEVSEPRFHVISHPDEVVQRVTSTGPGRLVRWWLDCGHGVEADVYELCVTQVGGLRPLVSWLPRGSSTSGEFM